MKKFNLIIKIFAFLVILLTACSEDILDKTPLDRYSDALVWKNFDLVNMYINSCYSKVLPGGSGRGFAYGTDMMVGEVTLNKGGTKSIYNAGEITPDNLGSNRGHLNWTNYYNNIQSLNVFIDKIDKVSEAYGESERAKIKAKTDILKGEALFLRAYFYSCICLSYGGIPLLDKPSTVGDDFSTIARSPFKETIDFIAKDCNDAAQLLKLKSEMEMGRATKEAALALKSRMLLFAASDLTADGTAGNELVGYSSPNRTALWTAARDAAKAVIDLGTCELADFGAPDQEAVAKNYFEYFKAYDLSSKEVIWGFMHKKDIGYIVRPNRYGGSNGNSDYGNNCPFQNVVDRYEMKDGSKFFDHFTINANDEYKNVSTKFHHENPYYDRDPRFYGSILYDSARWQPRIYGNLASLDPLGIYDRRTRIVKEGGVEISRRYGIDTQNGPVDNFNAGLTGYLTKIFMDDKICGRDEPNENIWMLFGYAEVLLNYAEACLELNDIPTATTNINMIRNRAGLPNFTGDITEALRYERATELFMQDIRWYDVRRWKILEETLTPRLDGMDITEIREGNNISTTWKRVNRVQPDNHYYKKMYWIPIATDEMKRAPLLVQNPDY